MFMWTEVMLLMNAHTDTHIHTVQQEPAHLAMEQEKKQQNVLTM